LSAGSRQQEIQSVLTEKGFKQTRQRSLITQVFVEAEGHISLMELLGKVQEHQPSIGYATVYRTMKLFVELGLADEHHFGDGLARFEIAHGDEHHDHLICVDCSHIVEFEDVSIEERQTLIAEQHGFSVVSHKHEVYVRCNDEKCPWRVANAAASV